MDQTDQNNQNPPSSDPLDETGDKSGQAPLPDDGAGRDTSKLEEDLAKKPAPEEPLETPQSPVSEQASPSSPVPYDQRQGVEPSGTPPSSPQPETVEKPPEISEPPISKPPSAPAEPEPPRPSEKPTPPASFSTKPLQTAKPSSEQDLKNIQRSFYGEPEPPAQGFGTGIAVLLLIASLVLGAAAGFGYSWYRSKGQSETPAETISPEVSPGSQEGTSVQQGWKVYRNSKLSFSINYPVDWKYRDRTFGEQEDFIVGFAPSDSSEAFDVAIYKSKDTKKYPGKLFTQGEANVVVVGTKSETLDQMLESFKFTEQSPEP